MEQISDAVIESLCDVKTELPDNDRLETETGISIERPRSTATRPPTARPNITVVIVNQPDPDGARFRYASENRTCVLKGTLPDSCVTAQLRGPDVGHFSKFTAIVSCVEDTPPHRPHPHQLKGTSIYCKDYGAVAMPFDENLQISLKDVGIQCVKKTQALIDQSLEMRRLRKIDPFKTTFANKTRYNMDVVRLAVQVFCHKSENVVIPLRPVLSEPVRDKKSIERLTIVGLSHFTGPACGGQSMMLLCEKVNASNIAVAFHEMVDDEEVRLADATVETIHKQYAIWFRTPSCRNPNTTFNVMCRIRLYNKATHNYSDFVEFECLAMVDPEVRKRKRARIVQPDLPDDAYSTAESGTTREPQRAGHRERRAASDQLTRLLNQIDLSNADAQSPIIADDVLSGIMDTTTLDEYLPN